MLLLDETEQSAELESKDDSVLKEDDQADEEDVEIGKSVIVQST